jgi:tRNA-binding protein
MGHPPPQTGAADLAAPIAYADFDRVDMRVGRIVAVDDFPSARRPAWLLTIDLGPLGRRRSSAQITNYTREELLGRQVICVVNFPPKQIGPHVSHVLTLGADRPEGGYYLLRPDPEAPLGSRVR